MLPLVEAASTDGRGLHKWSSISLCIYASTCDQDWNFVLCKLFSLTNCRTDKNQTHKLWSTGVPDGFSQCFNELLFPKGTCLFLTFFSAQRSNRKWSNSHFPYVTYWALHDFCTTWTRWFFPEADYKPIVHVINFSVCTPLCTDIITVFITAKHNKSLV
jgi:hypothetical protein